MTTRERDAAVRVTSIGVFLLAALTAREFEGQLSKIYLRWEYHGLGLGRRMMSEAARRFLVRGIHSFVLFAELSNPTLGFYDRLGGERLLDDRGQFGGAYAWRDVNTLIK
ncbi:MAG: GNAT family N-acetyltransferase [Fimbriimonadales bacterium]